MDHRRLFLPRDSQTCIACPDPPPCSCESGQQCVQIARTCTTCASFSCVWSNSGGGGDGGGVSAGAVAGAVVGSLILLVGVVALFIWNRRRTRVATQNAAECVVKDVPASASDVLNRPDPNEKAQTEGQSPVVPSHEVVYPYNHAHINLDPESQNAAVRAMLATPIRRQSSLSDPFGDGHSIQTSSTNDRSNVIPIALVPRSTPSIQDVDPHELSPLRPLRSPDLSLNMEHLNVSRGDTPFTPSARSGVTRHSYMSGATTATDLLNEAPAIISAQGAVRQVLGVVKAEVVQAPGSAPHSPAFDEARLHSPAPSVRPSIRSPLASTSFGPAEAPKESEEERPQGDPFADRRSAASHGSPLSSIGAVGGLQSTPWALDSTPEPNSRPASMATMATNVGTIIADISSATRVNVGLGFGTLSPVASMPASPQTVTMSPAKVVNRMTSGRLVTPPSGGGSGGTLQEQQERALAHAHAMARDQSKNLRRGYSTSSVATTSTRADTILEAFPFVPPSPISDRPIRTPPRSPHIVDSFVPPVPPLPNHPLISTARPEPIKTSKAKQSAASRVSRVSQVSTASSGLGSYTFQIAGDAPELPIPDVPGPPYSAISSSSGGTHHRRVSLDTVALTNDLSQFPLGFDQSAGYPPTPAPPRQ